MNHVGGRGHAVWPDGRRTRFGECQQIVSVDRFTMILRYASLPEADQGRLLRGLDSFAAPLLQLYPKAPLTPLSDLSDEEWMEAASQYLISSAGARRQRGERHGIAISWAAQGDL
jgi:hypothetical protein